MIGAILATSSPSSLGSCFEFVSSSIYRPHSSSDLVLCFLGSRPHTMSIKVSASFRCTVFPLVRASESNSPVSVISQIRPCVAFVESIRLSYLIFSPFSIRKHPGVCEMSLLCAQSKIFAQGSSLRGPSQSVKSTPCALATGNFSTPKLDNHYGRRSQHTVIQGTSIRR